MPDTFPLPTDPGQIEAVYLNRITGEEVVGRPAIQKQFNQLFGNDPKLKLAVTINEVRFLSPNVAVEHGRAKFIDEGATDEPEIVYSAVHVKQGGEWLIDRITDESAETPHALARKALQDLAWMEGSWVQQDEQVLVESECRWAKNECYLTRSFSVAIEDALQLSGFQVIGWDPILKKIRSWTFDSEGGFAEADWTKKGDQWYIRNRGYFSSGETASMVNIMRCIDDDTFTWQTTDRMMGAELLPDVPEVVIIRE